MPPSGPIYASFVDPVVNDQPGSIAFLASLNGPGVSRTARTGLWFARAGESIKRVVRLGDFVPNFDGTTGEQVFSDFLSIALPSGLGSGPIFLAKVKGAGVASNNSTGLFSLNGINGNLRKLLRTGDRLSGANVKRMAVLQPAPGVLGATRSFNATNSCLVRVTLTDKREAIINAARP